MPGVVRDCRRAVPESFGGVKLPTESVTTLTQLVAKTQLTAGALTLTTVSAAAWAESGSSAAAAARKRLLWRSMKILPVEMRRNCALRARREQEKSQQRKLQILPTHHGRGFPRPPPSSSCTDRVMGAPRYAVAIGRAAGWPGQARPW